MTAIFLQTPELGNPVRVRSSNRCCICRSFLFAVRTGHWETEKVEQKTQENSFSQMHEPECRQCVESFCGAFTPKNRRIAEKSAAMGENHGGFFFSAKGGKDMKNIFKKALSFFLAVIMTVGIFPVTIFAEEYVYFSISLDDKFIDGKDGTVMARVPLKISELESIKLADFGLE